MLLVEKSRELGPSDFRGMRVGRTHWGVTVEQIPDKCAYKGALLGYLRRLPENLKHGWGLFLWGDYGTGKTSAAVIVMKEVVGRGGRAMMVSAGHWGRIFLEKERDDDGVLWSRRLLGDDLVVIDDLGVEWTKDFDRNAVHQVIRDRYEEGRSVIVTSNMDPESAGRWLGDRVARVLNAKFTDVMVEGKDWTEDEVDRRREYESR